MFLEGPLSHLINTEGSKQISSPTSSKDGKGNPAQGFPKIIGTTNHTKSPSIGNASSLLHNLITFFLSSKPSQHQMAFIITELKQKPTSHYKVNCEG